MLKRYTIIILISLLIATSNCIVSADSSEVLCPAIPFNQLTPEDIAKFLGWVKDSKRCTLCGGSYVDSSNIINTPAPKAMQETPMNVTSSKHAFVTQSGTSIVKGDVTLIQPGREISADCVTFFRNSKTGKITDSILVGHVNFHEYGKLIVAERSNLNFVSDVHTLDNGFYRLLSSTPSGITNVWGRAKHTIRNALGVLKMRRATYSSCPPDAASWHLWSQKLTLNRNTGRGEAFNAFFFIKKVPVFYTPYFNFPIDKRRKSGFLFPAMSTSKDSGFGFSLPYYFNLAPNYDATFMPVYFSKRGFLLDGLFNYLTPKNSGNINVRYIPHDNAFISFRDNATSTEPHALSVLQKNSSHRGLFGLKDDLHVDEHWKASLNVNYVTDDYFLRDFSSATTMINEDQLFNQAEINYASDHWHFSSRVQGFQTLHPIGRTVSDQYKRLPQLDLGGDFPDGLGGLNYQLDAGVINFVHRDNFYSPYNPVVAGGRFNIGTGASLPLNWLGAYITPKVQLQATGYNIHDQEKVTDPNNITRILPLISVDSGAIFSRDIKFFHNSYTQTLEPRLFYLFVPTKNQDNIPNFDTTFPGLDFSQIFRTNRFSGIDRIGDANQITAAITTKFLDDSGQEKLNAGLGQILSIHEHMVMIPGGTPDPLAKEILSPLVGQLQYFITSKINTKVNAAWDPNNQRFNTSHTELQYNDNSERVINFWYDYSLLGDTSPQKPKADLSRVGVSLGWRLWNHWNILGSLYYNTSYNRAQNSLYGLEYDSCCWALRLVQSRTFVNMGDIYYATRTYVQFFLKGLGDSSGYTQGFGDRGADLPGSISGYNDKRVIGL